MKHEGAHFSLGPGTYRVPMRLHADNRRRLVERLRAKDAAARGVVLLEGGQAQFRYDTDTEEHRLPVGYRGCDVIRRAVINRAVINRASAVSRLAPPPARRRRCGPESAGSSRSQRRAGPQSRRPGRPTWLRT